MTKRSILITGCSSGIGYDAAHRLHQRGWQVFATCRTQEDCDRLQSEGLNSFRLDYDDAASITTALQTCLTQTGGTLDAVFNNGAFAIPAPVEDISRDALRHIFEANFFGHFDLIRQVIPVMRKQGHGRIVNCSSVLGLAAMRYRGAYNATKFALEGMTDTLRLELRGSGIHTILIEPGPIRTDFRKNAIKQFERWIDWENSKIRDQYETELLDKLKKTGSKPDRGELGPEAVTEKLIHAIESTRPKPRYFVTWPTYMADMLRRLLPTRALDGIFGRM
ncbi:SDR family NAD(P)-dependent oxidoreductase [Neptunicoccus sediminis]|uniref:SDR family NAD(P)-dependent oxidoreductase n=1 Tax=Neptunicoccus sediminis TaxID=1892596 RepID=UPI0008461DE8|nr:SDR family NAD(P)-dependent oxidoreductase [Neptunicoccus sediminis]